MELKAKILFLLPTLALLVYLIVSNTQSPNSGFLNTEELSLAEFEKFVMLHNRAYSGSEKEYRFQVFKSNSALIREINAQDLDFKLGVNLFADLTHDEFAEMQGHTTRVKEYGRRANVREDFNLQATPTDWDWRDKGAVSDVMNQGNCKGSWAIASAGAVEGARVSQGLTSLIELSTQEILDCANGSSDHGCNGGLVDDAFFYVQQSGLTSDLIYPYTGTNQTCNSAAASQSVIQIHGFYDVPANDITNLITAVAYTPVVAHVEADGYVWQFYTTGVINKYCSNNVKHSVLVVGYSQSSTPPYYIVKNSWGQQWGESGYVRIGLFGGPGICGIQSLSSYPTL